MKTLLPAVNDTLKTGPVILFLDGHKSHETLALVEIAKKHGITLFVFPPHTTHLLQPLDVGVFGPFKRMVPEFEIIQTGNNGSKIGQNSVPIPPCQNMGESSATGTPNWWVQGFWNPRPLTWPFQHLNSKPQFLSNILQILQHQPHKWNKIGQSLKRSQLLQKTHQLLSMLSSLANCLKREIKLNDREEEPCQSIMERL